jgi:hypothetical protein
MHCMEPRTLKHLAGIYILRCEVEGRSPFTVSAYRWTLARFISAMGNALSRFINYYNRC